MKRQCVCEGWPVKRRYVCGGWLVKRRCVWGGWLVKRQFVWGLAALFCDITVLIYVLLLSVSTP